MVFMITSCNQTPTTNVHVKLETTHGDIIIRLSDETPGHRANFIKLVEEEFYSDIFIHRVVPEFVIQTGNPNNRRGVEEDDEAHSYNYTIPAEIVPELYHHRGAIGAARTGDNVNPERNSSGTQFYIVVGRLFTDEEIDNAQSRIQNSQNRHLFTTFLEEERRKAELLEEEITDAELQERASLRVFEEIEKSGSYEIPEEHREVYKTEGGAPHLDSQYTVFGTVIEGMRVVDAIAEEELDGQTPVSKEVRVLKATFVKVK